MSGDRRPSDITQSSLTFGDDENNPPPPPALRWFDYVQAKRGTSSQQPVAPPPGPAATDRKRRNTEVEHERRHAIPRPGPSLIGRPTASMAEQLQATTPAPGSTRQTAIDLTTPPRTSQPLAAQILPPSDLRLMGGMAHAGARPPPQISHSRARSSVSHVPLPRWQPDADVTECPICNTEFTFWYRKHHCRKCGRVVCAACSPHRITIPREYIVHPPLPFLGQGTAGDQADYGQESAFFGRAPNPTLGGGEVVRVCNPCVPDPWTPGGPASSQAHQANLQRSRSLRVPPTSYHQPSNEALEEAQWPQRRESAFNRQRAHSYHPAALNRDSLPQSGSSVPALSSSHNIHSSRSIVRVNRHRHTQSTGSHALLSADGSRIHAGSPPAPPIDVRPRRQVREEDECPVCGIELPPGDVVREAHVEECIASRFSSSTPLDRAVPIPPAGHSTIADQVAGSSASPTTTGAPASHRASAYRPRGILLSRATEKDCVTEDGEAQECIICFEEFQPGDELGRMECLCKFHRTCIRQWCETKGAGSCPTHQLHD